MDRKFSAFHTHIEKTREANHEPNESFDIADQSFGQCRKTNDT